MIVSLLVCFDTEGTLAWQPAGIFINFCLLNFEAAGFSMGVHSLHGKWNEATGLARSRLQ